MSFDPLNKKYLIKSLDEINKEKIKTSLKSIMFHEEFQKYVQFFDMSVTDIEMHLLTCLSKGLKNKLHLLIKVYFIIYKGFNDKSKFFYNAIVFNQLDQLDLIELSSMVEGNNNFEFSPAYLLREALLLNRFDFFNVFINSGIDIKCLLDKIMTSYNFLLNKIYNRRVQNSNVIEILNLTESLKN